MVDLSEALKKNSTLAILDLGGLASKMNVISCVLTICIENDINDHGATELSHALMKNTALTELNLECKSTSLDNGQDGTYSFFLRQ